MEIIDFWAAVHAVEKGKLSYLEFKQALPEFLESVKKYQSDLDRFEEKAEMKFWYNVKEINTKLKEMDVKYG